MKIWATITSIILLSGMLGFGSSAYAVDLPQQGQPEQSQNGCDKSDPRSGGNASNNPQCDQGFTECDTDGDLAIDAVEIAAHTTLNESEAQDAIDDSEDFAAGASEDTNDNGVIDTEDELVWLNGIISPGCF